MIYTYLFQKEFSSCSWDVAHLYEHAFCHAYFAYLLKNDVNPSVCGFLNADTFERVIYIYASFYNKKTADLFEKFINTNDVSEEYIDIASKEIGLEDKSIYKIVDQAEFNNQFSEINQIIWADVSLLKTAHSISDRNLILSPFSMTHSAKTYRDVIISNFIENGTADENALMLRWSMVLDDVIRVSLNSDMICYLTYSSPAYIVKDNFVGRTQIIRFSKDISLQDIKINVENIVKAFDLKKNYSYIKDHFSEYSNQPTWRDDPITYYRYSSIVTSSLHISSLATIDNLQSLTDKVKITAQNYTNSSRNRLQEQLDK